MLKRSAKMKRPKARIIPLLLSGLVLLGFVIASVPREIEGFYSTGKLLQCMCDSKHYLRFHNGSVAHYATEHSPADWVGSYEKDRNGGYSVYYDGVDKQELMFRVSEPRLGYLRAIVDSEDNSCLLRGIPATSKLMDLVDSQEVKQISISEEEIIVTYYDSEFFKLREEVKAIPKSRQKQMPNKTQHHKSDRAGGSEA